MFYIDLFRTLQESNVRYLVVEGVAMNLHGIPRSTADIDLFVGLEERNIRNFLSAMNSMGFAPAVPVPPEALADAAVRLRWKEEKNMLVLSFRSPSRPAVPIDVFIYEPIPFEEAYTRRKRFHAAESGVEITAASEADLILMKERAGRQQDLSDVEALRRKMGEKK
jgi:hypothetical protein